MNQLLFVGVHIPQREMRALPSYEEKPQEGHVDRLLQVLFDD